ncbi:MAG TPA: sulfur carrier protein ThiS [Candidatus Binatia bacterium]|nr:sulfur carrier protein ThiS [Candidatus Binatia bacterium]
MKATINGESREIGGEATVERILSDLHIPPAGTAVAVNDRVVPKAEHATYRVREGDRIEIIVAVAGG